MVSLPIIFPAKSDPAELVQVGSLLFFKSPAIRDGLRIETQR
jgi:hypothetical protein